MYFTTIKKNVEYEIICAVPLREAPVLPRPNNSHHPDRFLEEKQNETKF